MKKIILLVFLFISASLSMFAMTITGPAGYCTGGNVPMFIDSASTGGTWSSSNTAVATIHSVLPNEAMVHTGTIAGTTIITYTLGASSVSVTFTVSTAPGMVFGAPGVPVCPGGSMTLHDAVAGGTWSSTNTAVATVNPATGAVSVIGLGSVNIQYIMGPECYITEGLWDNIPYAGSIGSPSSVMCIGTVAALTETVTGGTWSSSNTAIATVGMTSGIVSPISTGTVNISYHVPMSPGLCGPNSTYDSFTVVTTSPTTPATLSGPTTVYATAGIPITATYSSGGSGTWSSSSTSIATVGSTGVVTGISAGTTIITFTLMGCSGPVISTWPVTVLAFEGISGYIHFSGPHTGSVRTWLIAYNPTTYDLEAIDSTTRYMSGDSILYYEFAGLPTDSFRVKSSISYGGFSTTLDYMPTYHTSSYYWHDADVIYHTSGTADVHKDIYMTAGTATPGTGFIGGSVTTGANRGTTDGSPVANLGVFAINATTGAVAELTYTDASGHYSFSGLAFGTYLIHPELINYSTIPWSAITLSASSSSMAAANFIEHTISHVISPTNVGAGNVQALTPTMVIYPNPANKMLYLSWNGPDVQTGTLNITDAAGRNVYQSPFVLKGGAETALALPPLANGIYIVTAVSSAINHTSKLTIQH